METHSDSKYVCDQCGAELNSKRSLDSHKGQLFLYIFWHLLTLIETNEMDFSICLQAAHIHRDPGKRTCDICSIVSISAKQFKVHMRIHTGEKRKNNMKIKFISSFIQISLFYCHFTFQLINVRNVDVHLPKTVIWISTVERMSVKIPINATDVRSLLNIERIKWIILIHIFKMIWELSLGTNHLLHTIQIHPRWSVDSLCINSGFVVSLIFNIKWTDSWKTFV